MLLAPETNVVPPLISKFKSPPTFNSSMTLPLTDTLLPVMYPVEKFNCTKSIFIISLQPQLGKLLSNKCSN